MMKTNHLPQADFLDILFEHRNKSYGAYALRRLYPVHLFKALCMGMFLAGAFIILISYNQQHQLNNLPFIPVADTLIVVAIPPPEENLPPIEPLPPAGPAPTQNTIKDFVPLIVPEETPIDDSVPTVDERAENAIGKENIKIEGTGVEDNTNGNSVKPVPSTPPVEIPEIFEISSVQEPASFPGGNKALLRFMENNIRDPRNGEQDPAHTVKVQVKFVVGKDGQASQFVVTGSGGEKFDHEVIRVLRKMPIWKPARQNNREVAMYFIMPVSFTLIGDE
jgi:protein TonB